MIDMLGENGHLVTQVIEPHTKQFGECDELGLGKDHFRRMRRKDIQVDIEKVARRVAMRVEKEARLGASVQMTLGVDRSNGKASLKPKAFAAPSFLDRKSAADSAAAAAQAWMAEASAKQLQRMSAEKKVEDE